MRHALGKEGYKLRGAETVVMVVASVKVAHMKGKLTPSCWNRQTVTVTRMHDFDLKTPRLGWRFLFEFELGFFFEILSNVSLIWRQNIYNVGIGSFAVLELREGWHTVQHRAMGPV